MSNKSLGGTLVGNEKEKTVKTGNLYIQGHLLKWEGVTIQISNISLITSSNMNTPRFPSWAAITAFVGLLLLTQRMVWYVGLIALIIGGVSIYLWYSESQKSKNRKYLNILLNSGYTYSILFINEKFLNEVMSVFANIFEEGAKTDIAYNYNIDLNNCKIDNNSSVINAINR